MSHWPPVEDPSIIFTGPSARGWHRLQTASECLQKYAWEYENGPKKDISKKPPLAIGSLIHLALAQHYARMKLEQEGKNPEEFLDPAESVRLIAALNETEEHVENVLATYEAYRRSHWQDIHNRAIVGVEMLFDGRLQPSSPLEQLVMACTQDPDWNRLTGRVDLLYRDLSGALWAEDHKSTARLQRAHKQYFAISGQMLGYEHICRQEHPDLSGFKINLIQHASRGEPRFQRLTLPCRDALSRQFVDRAIDIELSIQRIKKEGRPVDEWPKAMSELTCYHRYGACDHIHKCRMGPQAGCGGGWSWEG